MNNPFDDVKISNHQTITKFNLKIKYGTGL